MEGRGWEYAEALAKIAEQRERAMKTLSGDHSPD